jgi:hypothetical protein
VKGHFQPIVLLKYLVVISNCWGLFLIIVFLGHGLIAVPRYFWKVARYRKYLDFLYIKLTHLDEEVINATSSLDESVRNVCGLANKLPKNTMLQTELEQVLSICPQGLLDYHMGRQTANSFGTGAVTEKRLVEVHRELKNSLGEYRRTKCEWNKLVRETIYYEDIVEGEGSVFRRVVFSVEKTERKRLVACRERAEWYWLIRIKPFLCKILAGILGMASLIVLVGETTLFINSPISVFPLLAEKDFGIIVDQLIYLVPLSYILYCTYFAFFSLKLPGLYGLYVNNTDSCSLTYCAYYLSRLSAPLAYNFFLLVKVKDSVFFMVMGNGDVVEQAGKYFAMFFPLLLVLFSLLNYLNAYGRLLNLLGINQLSYFDETAPHKIYEGKNMIKREKMLLAKAQNSTTNWEMTNMEILKDSGYVTLKL